MVTYTLTRGLDHLKNFDLEGEPNNHHKDDDGDTRNKSHELIYMRKFSHIYKRKMENVYGLD